MSTLADRLLQLGFEPLEDTFAAVPARDLTAIEKRVGPLPEDYKALVRRVGGAFFPGHATVAGFPLGLLYGGTTNRSLRSRIDMYDGRIPQGMIPIADGRGDQFLLCLTGTEKGGVFHWDHHCEADPDDYLDQDLPVPGDLMYANVTKVAPSITAFVESININGRPPKPSSGGPDNGAAPPVAKEKTTKKKAKPVPRKRAAKKSPSRSRRKPK